MNIADNVVRHALRNVYFLTGTACGGKTTISQALAEKYRWVRYDADERYDAHRAVADTVYQPAMTAAFADWQTYFMRPPAVYQAWLDASMREQLEMALTDLMVLAADQTVVADLHMPVEVAKRIAVPNQVVCLVTTPERVARDYFDRPDHRAIRDCLEGLPDPARAIENVRDTLKRGARKYLDDLKDSGLVSLWRDEYSTVAGTLAQVEAHFGLI